MEYTADSIIKTEEGLYLADSFLQAILDRVNALDAAGLDKEAGALFAKFDLPTRA